MADDSVSGQLAAIFDDVGKTCSKESKKTLRKHANALKRKIQRDSPKKKGDYAKGWAAKVEHESEFDLAMVVRNTAKPTMPHLLENSHIIRVRKGKKGGYAIVSSEKKQRTEARPHILKNAEEEIQAFYDELKGGGV